MEDVEDPWSTYVRPHFDKLVESMRLIKHLDRLYAKEIIDLEEYNELLHANADGSNGAVRKLLMNILPKKLPKRKYFDGFIEVLEACESQRTLADLIRPPSPPKEASDVATATTDTADAEAREDGEEAMEIARTDEAKPEEEEEEEEEKESEERRSKKKLAIIYIQADSEKLREKLDKLESRLKIVLKEKLGIDDVMFVLTSEERRPSDVAVVANNKMQVLMQLGGIGKSEFAKVKPFFQLIIALFFKIPRANVDIKAEFTGSVEVLIEVPLDVAFEMICLMDEGEAQFAAAFKTVLPEVTTLANFIGGLPPLNVPLPAEPPQRSEIRNEVRNGIRKQWLYYIIV